MFETSRTSRASNSTRDAQLNGQIDLAYEYTGTGWINYLGNETPLPDSQAQFEAVRDADLAANDMVWTDPAPMNNTYALAMSKETAEKTGVKTVSDYAKLVESDPGAAVTCVETEFNVRQDGYPGLAAKYGFDASRAQRQILQTGIIYQATADGDQCKFGEVFTTDGRIIALDLVLLDDDLQFFPKYNPALVMKKELRGSTSAGSRSHGTDLGATDQRGDDRTQPAGRRRRQGAGGRGPRLAGLGRLCHGAVIG